MVHALVLSCAAATIDAQGGTSSHEPVFVEITAARDSYFVREPIRVVLRVGVDSGFLKTNMIPLGLQRLDVPVEVRAPALRYSSAAVALASPAIKAAGGRRMSFVLNDAVVRALRVADRVVDGRRFTVLEVETQYRPARPGLLSCAAPSLRYAYATRFRDDFVQGRVAADWHDGKVRGQRLELRVRPLPAAGRPLGFAGAVGRFTVHAEIVGARAVTVGETLKLVLRIEGEGNFNTLEVPQLGEFDGFHVYGKIDGERVRRRIVTYDLVPLRVGVATVPPIRFAFFDPVSPAGYRVVETGAIPVDVRPRPDGAREFSPGGGGRRPVPGVDDIFDIKSLAGRPLLASQRRSPSTQVIVLLMPWLLAFGIASWLRGRSRTDSDRTRAAAAAFRAAAGRPDTDVADAFTAFLAGCLGCPAAAVIDADLSARLVAAGAPAELAGRTAILLEGLLAARYGGSASAGATATAAAVVAALEAALATSTK